MRGWPRDSSADLPKKAPELYQDRAYASENPPDFINRVYNDWLGKGLAKNNLMKLDSPLYFAHAGWVRRHGRPDNLDLPTLKELNDLELKMMEMGDGETLPCPAFRHELKDQIRLYNAARNRAKKEGKSKE